MKTRVLLVALLATPLTAFAADVNGTWKAEFDTQRGLQKYTFTLKQDGTKVTGKVNVDNNGEKRETELKDGKVHGLKNLGSQKTVGPAAADGLGKRPGKNRNPLALAHSISNR